MNANSHELLGDNAFFREIWFQAYLQISFNFLLIKFSESPWFLQILVLNAVCFIIPFLNKPEMRPAHITDAHMLVCPVFLMNGHWDQVDSSFHLSDSPDSYTALSWLIGVLQVEASGAYVQNKHK